MTELEKQTSWWIRWIWMYWKLY